MRCQHIYKDSERNRERNRVGKQCGKWAEEPTKFCRFHGSRNANVLTAQFVEDTRTAMQRFTDLEPEDSPLLDPYSALIWEFRRSIWRIKWYDDRLAELKDERSLVYGLAKMEKIGATEFAGTNKTYEVKENAWLKLQNEERKRLQDLIKFWHDAKIQAANTATIGAFRTAFGMALTAILEEFEIDLDDTSNLARLDRVLARIDATVPLPIVSAESLPALPAGTL